MFFFLKLITAGDVLCSNTSPGKTPKPTCVVKKYKASKNPLLLVVRAGNVDDVSLSARMAFTESAAALGYNVSKYLLPKMIKKLLKSEQVYPDEL